MTKVSLGQRLLLGLASWGLLVVGIVGGALAVYLSIGADHWTWESYVGLLIALLLVVLGTFLVRRLQLWTSPRWVWVERARVVIEILAFLVAGAWALFTFGLDKYRTYQEGGAIEGSLGWRKSPTGECVADYDVKFTNVSKIPVTIEYGVLRISTMKDVETDAKKHVRYIIPLEQKGTLLFEAPTDRFNGTYQPGEADQEGFTFFLDHEMLSHANSPVLIELLLWDKAGAQDLKMRDEIPVSDKKARWWDNRWDWLCPPKDTRQEEQPLSPKRE